MKKIKIKTLLLLSFFFFFIGCKDNDKKEKDKEENIYFFNSKYHAIQVQSLEKIDTLKWDSLFNVVFNLKKINERDFLSQYSKNHIINFDWKNINQPKISFYKKNDSLIYKISNLEGDLDSIQIKYLNKLKDKIENSLSLKDEKIFFEINLPNIIFLKDSINLKPLSPLPN